MRGATAVVIAALFVSFAIRFGAGDSASGSDERATTAAAPAGTTEQEPTASNPSPGTPSDRSTDDIDAISSAAPADPAAADFANVDVRRISGEFPGDPRSTDGSSTSPVLEEPDGRLVVPNFDPDEVRPTDEDAGPVSYTWTAPRSETITVDTHGSEMDTVLTVTDSTSDQVAAVGDDDGDVLTSSVTVDVVSGHTYDFEVTAKDGAAGLVSIAWKPVIAASRQADVTPPAVSFGSIPIAANTGEKPQSKVWKHDGNWFAVVASDAIAPSGTWLWKLGNDDRWRPNHFLSDADDVRGDAKQVGDVVHILLHGPSSELVSVQYDASTQSYVPWSQRSSSTAVSLPGSETATIDIDSTGRLWLAVDAAPNVNVYYSDAPYTSFSGPVTIASGIDSDDIAVVTALPGKIGVLWSNQNSERYGFKTHNDGAPPTSWSSDEVPAGSSAVDVGDGMADDHLNVAVASDGTLYAAVKTSYDSGSLPAVALLVRRPNGSWDPLYPVDGLGTRGIVLLNEDTDTVSVLYTETVNYNDIMLRTSPTSSISFGPATEVIDGSLDNVTSTKSNWTGEALFMASTFSGTSHAFLGAPPEPSGPVAADGSITVDLGATASSTLGVESSSGGALTFEIVTPPSIGTAQITDTSTGAFDYTADGGVAGADAFTFRVGEGGDWSDPATVSVNVVDPGDPGDPGGTGDLRGSWTFDSGVGPIAIDSSSYTNHGNVIGSPTTLDRAGSPAIEFDGSSDYVSIPDDPSLDLTSGLTVAAWIAPTQNGTQYLVKKAVSSSDGYELSLSSSGSVFVRFDRGSSGNTYRLDSDTDYTTDGSWMHVAATFDGTTIRLYVNGIEEASGPGPSSGIGTNNYDLVLGAQSDGSSKYEGGLDEVVVHARALNVAEISALAAVPPPPAPVAADASIEVESGATTSGLLGVTSWNGGNLTFEIASQPTSGSVVLTDASSGAFEYTADAGALGTDSFTFRVAEAGSWSEPATIDVSIVEVLPPAPVAADSTIEVESGASVSGTFGVESSGGGPLTFELVSQPAYGTVSVTDTAAGVFEYSAAAGSLGGDAFSFRVAEAGVWSVPATVSVTITPPDGDLRGSWSFDGGAAATVADGSVFGQAGTVVGLPSWIDRSGSPALDLDGSSQYVRVPDADWLDTGSALTVAAWIAPSGRGTHYVVKKATSWSNGYELALSSSGSVFVRLNRGSSGNSYRVDSDSDYPTDGTWMHVAATYDGTTTRLYIDGVEEASGAGPSSGIGANNYDLVLGAQSDGAGSLEGGLDDVVVYGRALSASEVAELATSPTPEPVAPEAADASIVVDSGATVTDTLAASQSSGGTLTFEVVTPPASGSVTITDATTGTFEYTADTGTSGNDSFTFRVAEAGLWSEPATVSVTINPPVGTPGLVGHWTFDDVGSVGADSSGNGHDAVVVGSPTTVTHVESPALEFDGNDYLRISDRSALDLTSAITMSAWIAPDGVQTQYIVKKATSSSNGYELSLSSAGKVFVRFNRGSSGNTYRIDSQSNYPTNGTWMHVLATFDGSTMRLYINGVEEASAAGPSSGIGATSRDLVIGAQSDGSQPFEGSMDDVRLYDRAVSTTEIGDLYGMYVG